MSTADSHYTTALAFSSEISVNLKLASHKPEDKDLPPFTPAHPLPRGLASH